MKNKTNQMLIIILFKSMIGSGWFFLLLSKQRKVHPQAEEFEPTNSEGGGP